MKNVIVVHYGDVSHVPPVINLLRTLLQNGEKVSFICNDNTALPKDIIHNNHFKKIGIVYNLNNSLCNRIKRRLAAPYLYRKALRRELSIENAIVWTTSDSTVKALGKMLFSCKHVMELLELIEYVPMFRGAKLLKFNIAEYAKHAYKVVVPEENRAYIQKVLWGLERLPVVLPNKPNTILEDSVLDEHAQSVVEALKRQDKKIILYVGGIFTDRDLEPFASAISSVDDEFCFCIAGRIIPETENNLKNLLKEYKNAKYVGYIDPPCHVEMCRYAYIGIVAYHPHKSVENYHQLNGLYCAPNKIWEYASYGVPMISNDLPGLKSLFYKYGMGVSVCELNDANIIEAIKKIDSNHIAMSNGARKFFNSISLNDVVRDILED